MLRLRPATMDDWARLYAWRNDPETRARFTSKQVVTLKDHLAWLAKTLDDGTIKLLLADDQERGCSVGTCRLDISRRKEEIWARCSVTVEPRLRGHGYGTSLVESLVAHARKLEMSGLVADIMPDNYASIRAFAASDFQPVKFTKAEDVVTLELAL